MAQIFNRTGENLTLDRMLYICFVCGMNMVITEYFEKNGEIFLKGSNKNDVEITRIGPTYITSELIFNK